MIVITLGDPFSINVAILERCLTDEEIKLPLLIVGSLWHWRQQSKCNLLPIQIFHQDQISELRKNRIYFFDVGGSQKEASKLSKRERGEIAIAALNVLKDWNLSSKSWGLLTAPIDKSACAAAGFDFPGQTEFCEYLSGRSSSLMLLAGPKLRVGLVTNHLALNQVAKSLSIEIVLVKIEILISSLISIFSIREPRIAVCGLNPHASDNGLFGDEESTIIRPAIEKFHLNSQFSSFVEGPLSSDTVFHRAMQGHYDAVLAIYHDQGLGPLKTVHFDNAINLTCGLPFLRVSPDHGPAQDLYNHPEKASSDSMKLALRTLHSSLIG